MLCLSFPVSSGRERLGPYKIVKLVSTAEPYWRALCPGARPCSCCKLTNVMPSRRRDFPALLVTPCNTMRRDGKSGVWGAKRPPNSGIRNAMRIGLAGASHGRPARARSTNKAPGGSSHQLPKQEVCIKSLCSHRTMGHLFIPYRIASTQANADPRRPRITSDWPTTAWHHAPGCSSPLPPVPRPARVSPNSCKTACA